MHKSFAQLNRGYELIYADYYSRLSDSSEAARLARSSFCEARDKLSWEAFDYLLGQANLERFDGFAPERWHGHRVRALDGTELQLPRSVDILKNFQLRGGGFGTSSFPYAQLFVATDIFTHQITHTLIDNDSVPERSHLLQMLNSFEKGDIAILDRGLDGKRVWRAFEERGQFFVGRLRVRGLCRTMFAMNRKDQKINLTCDDGSTLAIRVVRGHKFKTGNHLFIASNLLDEKKYTRADLLDLYQRRQAVEDVFLTFKTKLNAKNIRSKKTNGVLQEIYAALCATSMASGVRYLFEREMKKRRVSLKAICWKIGSCIRCLITDLSGEDWHRLRLELIKYQHLRQPGRSYPRYSLQPGNKWIAEKRKIKQKIKQRLRA